MYVAVSAIGATPAACVVVIVKTPQALPAQPLPLMDHESALLGWDPGTGVSVAVNGVAAPACRLPGAESCKLKWLVIVTLTLLCFVGSATLVAINVTLAEPGRICGAV